MTDLKISTAEQLFAEAINDKDNDERNRVHEAETNFYNSKLASKHFTAYYVGEEKILLYGNPMVMASSSGFWSNAMKVELPETNEPQHIMSNIKIVPHAYHFICLWSYMNGISNASTYPNDNHYTMEEIFYIFEIHNYFDVWLGCEHSESLDHLIAHINNIVCGWDVLDQERIEQCGSLLVLMSKALTSKQKMADHLKNIIAMAMGKKFKDNDDKKVSSSTITNG